MKNKAYRFDSIEEKEYWVNLLGKTAFTHVPSGPSERSGYLIQAGTPNWSGMWTSATRENFKNNQFANYTSLEEVLIEKPVTFEEQLVIAKKYIGKKIDRFGAIFPIVRVRVVLSEDEDDLTYNIKQQVKGKPWLVCIVSQAGCMFDVTEKDIKLLPDTKTITLTDDYDAVITKDSAKVGCQTITKEKIEEILTIMKELE